MAATAALYIYGGADGAVSFFGVGPDIPAVSPPTELDAILCPGPRAGQRRGGRPSILLFKGFPTFCALPYLRPKILSIW